MAHNFSLHWTGSSRFSLFPVATPWRLLPASELFVRRFGATETSLNTYEKRPPQSS